MPSISKLEIKGGTVDMAKRLNKLVFCVTLSILTGFACFVIPMDAAGQPAVECPCDYFAVPQTTACWVDPFDNLDPFFYTELNPPPPPPFSTVACEVFIDDNINDNGIVLNIENEFDSGLRCNVFGDSDLPDGCNFNQQVEDLTQEQFEACMCELQEYVNSLSQVSGISIDGGPPYICSDICPAPPTPVPPSAEIPTLSEWGLIAMTGILGLMGFMAIRRKKATS